LIAVFKELIHP